MSPESDYRNLFPHAPHILPKKSVTLVLGTDSHIGDKSDPETRVGITPRQASALKEFVEGTGASLTMYVVKDAGAGAGHSDEDYRQAGCEILEESDLRDIRVPPDVVHALKEPCSYESSIPGPFLRIGALHTGDDEPAAWRDLALLLNAGQCQGIFDGSMIGGHTMSYNGGFRFPIRQSMSVFAGRIAADMVGKRSREYGTRGRVVIVGGGVAGANAARQLIDSHQDICDEVVVIEEREQEGEALRVKLASLSESPSAGATGVRVITRDQIKPEDLESAVGLILAAAGQKPEAPKVVRDVAHLLGMSQHGLVVDVSIDEGGSVQGTAGESVKQSIEQLGTGIGYVHDKHMPRIQPAMASEEHGKAVLPYLGTLLYLCAREGGATEAARHILRAGRQECAEPEDHFAALVCDLGAGLVFTKSSALPANGMRLFNRAVSQPHFVVRMLADAGGPSIFPTEERKE